MASESAKDRKRAEKDSDRLVNLELDGTLLVDSLKIRNFQSRNTLVKVSAKEGVFRVEPCTATVYGGKYESRLVSDFRAKTPRHELKLNLANVQFGKFLDGIIKDERLTGIANISLTVSGSGGAWDALRRTLNGQGQITLKNGLIQGIQIVPDIIRNQVSEYDPKKTLQKLAKQQDFRDINAKITIRDGVISNSDLMVIAEHLKLGGKGIIDLAKGDIDYHFRADIAGIPVIPYDIKGSFSDITASLDTPEFLKNVAAGVIKSPLNLGTGVLDVGTDVLDKGTDAIGEGKGIKNVGKGVLNVGKGVLNMGKGVLNVGKGIVDQDKKVSDGAKDMGEGVKDVGKGVLDVGKGAVETIGGGVKKIFGEPEKEEKEKK
jgi:uncharacterized protein involved in outer membrane biogenesis